MNWWQYLLLANIYLVLFYAFYALLLRRETFFQLNRAYLVSAALLSFFIPLIQAGWVQNLFITQRVRYSIYGGGGPIIYQLKPVADAPVNIGQLIAGLYLAGVLFLTLRLVWQLVRLNKIIKQPAQAAAFSFFKKIKLDAAMNNRDVITAHEQVHAKQWHSADVLIIEAVMIINWLNPVVYFYRRAIKHIHEFIADSQALKTTNNKADYALLLLSQTFNAPSHQLANHFFNHSLLKQRIIMLQKNKSQRIALIKYGLSAPLFILMLVLSSATVNNSKAIKRVNKVAQKVFELPADTSIVSKISFDNNPQVKTVIIAPKQVDTQLTLTVKDHNLTYVDAKGAKLDTIRVDGFNAQTPQTANNGNNGLTYAQAKGVMLDNVQIKSLSLQNIQTDTAQGNDGPIFSAVETEPTFPGGIENFYKFLISNIRYPVDMRQNHVEGRAIITFIVEKDGSISNIKTLRAPTASAGDEAVRVMSLSPKWNPGLQNDRAVRVQYTIPISFNLGDKPIGEQGTAIGVQGQPITIKGFHTSRDTAKVTYMVLDGNDDSPKPLMVLDGKIIKDLASVKPADIYSISILKDKSATAQYGPAAVNGVIVITTKAAHKKQ